MPLSRKLLALSQTAEALGQHEPQPPSLAAAPPEEEALTAPARAPSPGKDTATAEAPAVPAVAPAQRSSSRGAWKRRAADVGLGEGGKGGKGGRKYRRFIPPSLARLLPGSQRSQSPPVVERGGKGGGSEAESARRFRLALDYVTFPPIGHKEAQLPHSELKAK